MRKVAGIYGPRHSLTVAAAKSARAARVAWAEAQWEVSISAEGFYGTATTTTTTTIKEEEEEEEEGGEGAEAKEEKGQEWEAKEKQQKKKEKKVVRFQPSASFFVEREPFVAPTRPSTATGADVEEQKRQEAEAQLQREMVIAKRLWGPLGERGRKQRDFKRTVSSGEREPSVYVPGRWAPPPSSGGGGDWLDTSGRMQTYDEFWGGKNGNSSLLSASSKEVVSGSVGVAGKVLKGVLLGKWGGGGGAQSKR